MAVIPFGTVQERCPVIETTYKGYRFRSRSEARLAIVLDALRIQWYYEANGYRLADNIFKLPDFLLQQLNLLLEYKGEYDPLDPQLHAGFKYSNFVVVAGSLWINETAVTEVHRTIQGQPVTLYVEANGYDTFEYNGFCMNDDDYRFCICPVCSKVGIAKSGILADICNCTTDRSIRNPCDPRLQEAFRQGRAARFEHGENPIAIPVIHTCMPSIRPAKDKTVPQSIQETKALVLNKQVEFKQHVAAEKEKLPAYSVVEPVRTATIKAAVSVPVQPEKYRGWFTVLKGAYPSLQQIDKTLNVGMGKEYIVRGSLIIVQDEEHFRIAVEADALSLHAYLYFSLHSTEAVQGKITGIACGMPFEFETSVFDISKDYKIGMLLTVGQLGMLVPHISGQNCIAQVTRPPYQRWVNDAMAVTGWRTGSNVDVLTARTLHIPALITQ